MREGKRKKRERKEEELSLSLEHEVKVSRSYLKSYLGAVLKGRQVVEGL